MSRRLKLVLVVCLAPLVMAQADGAKDGEQKKPADANAPAEKKAPPPDPTKSKAFQMGAWQTINSTGPRIDQCTQRYASEFPKARGSVDLQLTIAPTGKITKLGSKTALRSGEKLEQCLRDVASTWRFPEAPGIERLDTTIQVQVAKDRKFKLLKPGEKPAQGKKGEKKADDGGFLQFSPTWGSGFYQ